MEVVGKLRPAKKKTFSGHSRLILRIQMECSAIGSSLLQRSNAVCVPLCVCLSLSDCLCKGARCVEIEIQIGCCIRWSVGVN